MMTMTVCSFCTNRDGGLGCNSGVFVSLCFAVNAIIARGGVECVIGGSLVVL